ncbi:MAG TPA: LysR family transcriptional regulator [Phycisphaerales bacterium]|nr:LysR family transcriptional regulator [Phycisphaerales bacterium]
MASIDISDSVAALRQVNLNHLVYFWSVARTGSFTAAAKELGVSQPSISEQVAALEKRLGRELFRRTGRGVELTPNGQRTLRYAEEVVGMCAELVRARPIDGEREPVVLQVGAADGVPKIIVRSMLLPVLRHASQPSLVLREWRVDQLLGELSVRRLDMVICDEAISEVGTIKMISLEAGSTSMVLCAAPALAKQLKRDFPKSLNGAPIILPMSGTPTRVAIDRWLSVNGITPRIVVEAEDRSQMHHFAEAGIGALPVASLILKDIERQFGVKPISPLKGVTERYFVVMADRPGRVEVLDELRRSLGERQMVRAAGANGSGRLGNAGEAKRG